MADGETAAGWGAPGGFSAVLLPHADNATPPASPSASRQTRVIFMMKSFQFQLSVDLQQREDGLTFTIVRTSRTNKGRALPLQGSQDGCGNWLFARTSHLSAPQGALCLMHTQPFGQAAAWRPAVCGPESVPGRHPVERDHVAVIQGAVLKGASLCLEIDMDDPEALRVPHRPFEVVQQRPQQIPPHIGPTLDRGMYRTQVLVDVVDPFGIPNLAPGVHLVLERRAVLRDDQREPSGMPVQPAQQFGEGAGILLPAERGQRSAWWRHIQPT